MGNVKIKRIFNKFPYGPKAKIEKKKLSGGREIGVVNNFFLSNYLQKFCQNI